MTKPVLSIGIIFKNDIRCIERCLKALQPLRDAVACELVMADTGSTDGSREIAEKYADILFDFPWIDDFAAARNAVMDRCSGQWYFSVDTDEYLREDISELRAFLDNPDPEDICATVIVRNFYNYEMTGGYADLMGLRLARLSTGVRFKGAIHETFDFGTDTLNGKGLNRTILDHDGYVGFSRDTEHGKAKLKRNLELIRRELAKSPDNLLLHTQLIESSVSEPDYIEQIRQAVKLVQKKSKNWNKIGPVIVSHAVRAANDKGLPEFDEWVRLAEEWFPQSMYTRLDVEWAAFSHSWNRKNYDNCIIRGERFLAAMDAFRAGEDPGARIVGTLQTAYPQQEQRVRTLLANAYCNCSENNFERAFELFSSSDYAVFDAQLTAELLKGLQELHFRSNLDTSALIEAIWYGIIEFQPSQTQAEACRKAFFQTSNLAFVPENCEQEQKHRDFCRFAYTLYLPLYGKCEAGSAARLMESEQPDELAKIISHVENWDELSAFALLHALECGMRFPLPGSQVNVEDMDNLISGLVHGRESFIRLALQAEQAADSGSWQDLLWARGMLLAAVRTYPWTDKERDEAQGMALARAFATIESRFLPRCYSAEVLQEDKLFILPPLHRFGWYYARACDALGNGRAVEYVRLLRAGLDTCEGMKDMAEFLLECTPELRVPEPSPELRELADQIRTLLSQFAPDDPAVAALKQSEAYRKVAFLLDEEMLR